MPASPDSAVPDTHRTPLGAHVLEAFAPLGVRALVTARTGGVSSGPYESLNLGGHVGDVPAAVAENRSRLAAAMGIDLDALVIANQVHGADVAVVRRGDDPGDVDVLVTTDPSIALCVLVADCVPAVVVDPASGVLAVVHAGWQGVAARTIAASIDAVVSRGATPASCHVYLGPRISQASYEVGDEVAAALRAAGCGDDVVAAGDRHRADLARACVRQFLACGVLAEHVTVSHAVTDGGDRYFSDRAQRPCGRFAVAARLAPRS